MLVIIIHQEVSSYEMNYSALEPTLQVRITIPLGLQALLSGAYWS